MNTGQIYKWKTNKARGHDARYKYHLYIGRDIRNKNVFLFINSQNYFNEGFELKNSDYPFFQNESSYISCGTNIVSYSDNEIEHVSVDNYVGELKKEDITALAEHIERSEVMELRFIKFITRKLREY